MAAALARHDALMRATLEAHGGYVFKTIGDAFCAAFARASDAALAALDTQRALAAEDFSAVQGLFARMALHAGSADERDGDYFGPTVNRVARLLAIGHGGQVLVSGTAANLLGTEMPRGGTLRDLGQHRLKDLARPERVWQLIAPDLPESFPPLRSLDHLSNNLPAQLTTFVGRGQVIAEIKNLTEQHRLVTLTGTGGVGKTRCAIQIGAELLDEFGDGVWLAELAPISDPPFVTSVVARALNLQEQPNRPLIETLLTYLKRKRLLLILDNCEHVINEARHVSGAILRGCPEVRVIATSREPLNISGEATYRMPSLAIPSDTRMRVAEGVTRYGATQLFVDRAQLSNSRFTLTEENAMHVSEICRRLDGIPLAIELAAARIKVLSPKELAQKLGERFRLLTDGDRTALPRHRTMRALIDWSYDLLSDDERMLFRKLSIFAGGFTIESAATVCATNAIDEMALLELLTSLVDKSLVQAEAAAEGTRYRLLESTREYAREKLTERGEYSAVAHAHAGVLLALAEKLDRLDDTTPDRAWIAQAKPEMENWRAALGWSLGSRGDVALGQRLAGTMRCMWLYLAASEGRRWIRSALGTTDHTTSASVIGRLQLAEAQLCAGLVQHKASGDAAQRALEQLQEPNDADVVEAQRLLGRARLLLGHGAEGEVLLREALAGADRFGMQKARVRILRDLAMARLAAGDPHAARELFNDARTLARVLGADQLNGFVAIHSAELEFERGDASAAAQLASEALAASRSQNDPRRATNALLNLSAYLIALGRYEEGRNRACDALTLGRDLQGGVLTAFALQHLAASALFRAADEGSAPIDASARAARLAGYVDAQLRALEAVREYTEQQEYDKMMRALRAALGEEELRKLMAEGAAWLEDQAVAEAVLS